ncbi:ribonuclease H-like domain-containing protein [Thermodesulfatator atlanticus]|uniref:ribonuclease H-like domain-containing protein n=1 Tax=Thermodesulfatator atlanticus TaxID=501497 RepID=UPI0003B3CCE9|nr:ribonuclease H-like domain-containing protein [Thermodesulfatator atlanticus]
MLYRTFVHLPGLGERREFELWQNGVCTWWDFLAQKSLPGVSKGRLSFWQRKLEKTLAIKDDLSSLAALLRKKHHWRLFKHFKHRAIFLDIETDGLKRGFNQVTVIGIYDGQEFRAFLAGENLDEGLEILASAELVVTFGGSFFDYPFLRSHYPWLPLPKVHLDLCPLFKRLGLKGGLKAIERQLGIRRPDEVDGLDGLEAVRLWRRFRRRGDTRALEALINYNREDVMNLVLLAEILYEGLSFLTLTREIPALTVSSETLKRRSHYGAGSQRF